MVSTGSLDSVAPRITILTPCRNGVRYLREALESLQRQRYPNLEHIVLDAGSTDGTLELLSHYPDIRVISEADAGAHDAMNKGIAQATGDVIGFLNVDDFYANGVLAEVGRRFAADPMLDVAVGSSIVFEDVAVGSRHAIVVRSHARDNGFWLPELMYGHPGFNGRFFRRRVFELVGLFDNSYYIAADRHFLIRVALAGLKALLLDSVGIYYRHHASSQTMNPQRRLADAIAREHARMAEEFMARTMHDPVRRHMFAAWHVLESVKCCLRRLRAGEFAEAFAIVRELTRQNVLWSLQFWSGLRIRNDARGEERRGAKAADVPIP